MVAEATRVKFLRPQKFDKAEMYEVAKFYTFHHHMYDSTMWWINKHLLTTDHVEEMTI